MARLTDHIYTHRYTATVAIAAFSARLQQSEPSMDAYASSLQLLSPTLSSVQHCTVGDYLHLLNSYADMYDTVHQTSVMLIATLLAECGRVLSAASSMSSAAAGVQWKYVLVWRSGCGRDSDREQQLDRRWRTDKEWRKAESGKVAERKTTAGNTDDERRSDKKAARSKRK